MQRQLLVAVLGLAFSFHTLANEDRAFLSKARESFKGQLEDYQCLSNMEKLYHIYTRKNDSLQLMSEIDLDIKRQKAKSKRFVADTFTRNPMFANALREYSQEAIAFDQSITPLYAKANQIWDQVEDSKDNEEWTKAEAEVFALGIPERENDFMHTIEEQKIFPTLKHALEQASKTLNQNDFKIERIDAREGETWQEVAVRMWVKLPQDRAKEIVLKINLPVAAQLNMEAEIMYDFVPLSVGSSTQKNKSGFTSNYSFGGSANYFTASTEFDYHANGIFQALNLPKVAKMRFEQPYDFPENSVEVALGNFQLSLEKAKNFEEFYRDSFEILDEFAANSFGYCADKLVNNEHTVQFSNRSAPAEYRVNHHLPPEVLEEAHDSKDSH